MIERRVFIVGCARSGTTLLQSMLYAHGGIYSLPETAFFDALIGIHTRGFLRELPRTQAAKWRAFARDTIVKLGLVERRRQHWAWHIIREVAEQAGLKIPARSNSFLVSRQATAFVELMDRLAASAKKSIWVEKTPAHLYLIPQITRLVPGAQFIHIIRNGMDNVASLYENARKYPGPDWDSCSTVENAVRRWNIAVQISQNYLCNPAHYFVRYEDLASNPHQCLEGICAFLGRRFDDRMVTDYANAAFDLIQPREKWKSDNRRLLAGPVTSRYLEIFDAGQRAYIEGSLMPLPWPANS